MDTRFVVSIERRLWRPRSRTIARPIRSGHVSKSRTDSVRGASWRGAIVPPLSSSRIAARDESLEDDLSPSATSFGEDAAKFRLSEQRLDAWSLFALLVSSVLGALYVVISSTKQAHSSDVPSLSGHSFGFDPIQATVTNFCHY